MTEHGSTHSTPACPVCGGPIPSDSPQGLCPKCLLAGAFAEGPDDMPAADATRPEVDTGRRSVPPDIDRVRAAFPQLEIVELVGVGGMGAVYKARQKHLDRPVALKILATHLAEHPAFLERFDREARLLARLNHPNIVTVHDFGQAAGFCYLIMEFIDGVNLRQAMRAGRFAPEQALALVPRLCDALQFAHEEGVLHRDVKPENILLDARGRVKIADFGIAKLIGDAREDLLRLTASGAALGTPAYMAPEQIEHPSLVDHRADIYSLGVVLYEMLTGELPLGRFAPPSEKTPVDSRVDDLVFRALEKERERRFQSAAEVRTRVEQVTSTPGTGPIRGTLAAPGNASPGARPEYFLAHPELPRMVHALVAYGWIVAPAMFLLLLPAHRPQPDPSPYATFVDSLVTLFSVGGELLYLPVLFVAAWRLRAMRPGAPSFLRKVLWFHLAFGAIALLGGIWTETLRRTTDEPPGTHGEAAMLVLVVGAIAFEILSLRWLYRHRETLPLAFHNLAPNHAGSTSEIAGSAPGPRAVPGIPYPPESARHATLAAVLTAVSLLLGLPLLSGALMAIGTWLADERQARFGGLGPVELAIVLALGGLILGLAGTGTYLGLAARRQIAASPRGMHGLRRATFALLAWPLVVLSIAGLIPIGRLFYTSYYGLLLGLGTSMVLAEVYCRFAWRWVRGAERADSPAPRGCPAWMRGFGVAGMIAAAVVVTPFTALSLSRQIRASLPPPIHVLRGDPAAAERPADARSSLQFGLASAPRSIVYVETTLLRDGVLHTAPISTCHVLNTALENAESSLLLRVLPTQTGALDAVQWEWVTSAGDTSQTYRHVDSRTTGIALAPVAIPQRTSINVGAPFEVEILRGRGADGATWTVHLRLSSEALVPGVPVGGAVVGEGRSWSDTAHRLHPEPR